MRGGSAARRRGRVSSWADCVRSWAVLHRDFTSIYPVAAGQDCDDARDWCFPYAPEVCDSLDNDCDGLVDDSCM